MLENQESQERDAIAIAVAGGALSPCELHSEIMINNWVDPADAYKIGNARYTAGELTAEYSSRRELTDAIKEAIDDSVDSCPLCDKMLAD
jgi:hypothetical protein